MNEALYITNVDLKMLDSQRLALATVPLDGMSPEQRDAISGIQNMLTHWSDTRESPHTPRTEKIVRMAKDQHESEGEVEVDEKERYIEEGFAADVSEGDDNGAYVKAWVWVSFEGTEFDKEADHE